MMLGYEMSDLDEMRAAVTKALYDSKGLPTEKALEKTADFLDGLWAEGYFDDYQDQYIPGISKDT